MLRVFRITLIASLLIGLAPVLPAAAEADLPSNCALMPIPNSVEVYLICLPWPPTTPPPQFDLVVFAHGYVPPGASMVQYLEQLVLPDGTFLPSLANGLGYAFVSTSYTKNGLAVKEGLADTLRLVDWFKGQYPGVRYVYLIGASEGGLITTLAAEKSSPIAGGLALCGPIGNFRGQINYWGDFRVLFDNFYKNVLPPSPIDIPNDVMLNWSTVYTPTIIGLMMQPANQHATEQLLRISGAPIDPANPSTAIETTLGLLSYNVFATNEGKLELGGQPFDNKYKWYLGSDNDRALNGPAGVQRFKADLSALMEISRYYQTSGKLKVPLITMHTLGDPIVPYWHEPLYTAKTLLAGSALKHLNLPINRYGHCTFTSQEALAAFTILVYRVTGQLPDIGPLSWDVERQSDYRSLLEKFDNQLP
jgi:pimeloyl-ACP methyl ester carboxylesterase